MTRLTSTHIVYLVALLTIVAGTVLVGSTGRSFFSPGNISDILTGTSILGFIAALARAIGLLLILIRSILHSSKTTSPGCSQRQQVFVALEGFSR